MISKLMSKSLVTNAVLGAALAFSIGLATSGTKPPEDVCDPKKNPKDCVPICHNIGGPRDLGANCDMSGDIPTNCTVPLEGGGEIELEGQQFLGIIIGVDFTNNLNALIAHINHGDGPILVPFDPPLHLASVVGPHLASNVECLGVRVLPQPDEPGN